MRKKGERVRKKERTVENLNKWKRKEKGITKKRERMKNKERKMI